VKSLLRRLVYLAPRRLSPDHHPDSDVLRLYKVLFVTIEMRHAPFIGWSNDLSASDPTIYSTWRYPVNRISHIQDLAHCPRRLQPPATEAIWR